MSPWWVRACQLQRRRDLKVHQKIIRIDVEGTEHVRKSLDAGAGLLITPNHSFHYDSYVLIETAARFRRPFHFMTAWQVFAMADAFGRWSLQRHGCFSIDRESNDMQAFKQAVAILEKSPYPLVIFPEGDIYHSNDRITPFREGAAAIGLAASRRADRPIHVLPCALKTFYLDDPTPNLLRLVEKLEGRLYWRPAPHLSLVERIYRLADGVLALKELEHLGNSQSGSIPQRTKNLMETILARQESRFGRKGNVSSIPERVKELRQTLIERQTQCGGDLATRARLQADMEDLFFVIQLYSYPAEYVREKPTWERLAETLDKLEEDLLQKPYPGVRGRRRAAVVFGEPIVLPRERQKKDAVVQLTRELHQRVQNLINNLNESPFANQSR